MKKISIFFFPLLVLAGSLITPVAAEITTETFNQPDIRNDYCGAEIDGQWCKCAFHGELCERIGASESGANEKVQDGFTAYVEQKRNQFINNCVSNSALGVDAILDGDMCTRCTGEHFKINYKGEIRCATNEEMCGTEDPFLVWDIKNNVCVCSIGTEMNKETGMCEKEKIADIVINWEKEEPPFLADGIEGGVANITVTSAKGEPELLEAKIELATSYKPGTLEVDEIEKNYVIIYMSPDLMGQDATKNYDDFLVITYEAKNSKGELEERSESIKIPLVIGTPIEVSSFGFETKEDEIQFRGGVSNVKIDGRYSDMVFSLPNAVIKVTGGDEFVTDEEGKAEVETPNPKLTGETEDFKLELELSADIVKILIGAKKKYRETGIQNSTIATFLEDFPKKLAFAEDKEARQKLMYGLKRTEYALFFVKEGQKFGEVSAKSLGTVTKDAVINVYDMLDTITGATGKISDWINQKGVNAGGRAKEIIAEKLSAVRAETLKQMAAAFQAGVAKNAPNSKVWVGGLFKFLEDKGIADTAKGGYGEIALDQWIAEYFIKDQKKNSIAQMNQIAAMIDSVNFVSLEFSDDLENAKNRYVEMADNYIKAEEGEYFVTITKAYIDLGFDVIGKSVSILTPYGKLVEGLEKAYKVGRTAFLDSNAMYNWYVTNGDIVNNTEANVRKALGLSASDNEVSLIKNSSLLNIIIPSALAATSEGEVLSQYLMASLDAEFFESWAMATDALAELFPDEASEIAKYSSELRAKSIEPRKTAELLSSEVSEIIPVEYREDWTISAAKKTYEPTNKTVNDSSKTFFVNPAIIFGVAVVVLILIFVLGRKFLLRKK